MFIQRFLENIVLANIFYSLFAGIHLGIPKRIPPEISAGFPSQIPTDYCNNSSKYGIPSDFFPGILPEILDGIPPDVLLSIFFSHSPGIPSRTSSKISSGISSKTHPRIILWHFFKKSSRIFLREPFPKNPRTAS